MVKLITSVAAILGVISFVAADHTLIFRNRCGYAVNPQIVNVNCGYSPRCDTPGSGNVPNPAISYNGPQSGPVGPGRDAWMTVNRQWNGRVFHQTGSCGPKGESCTMGEFNFDTGDQWTPNSFDISNIQGFTQGMSIAVQGGDSVTCSNVNCGCGNAYPPNDLIGCGNNYPVRGASVGDHTWIITFCA